MSRRYWVLPFLLAFLLARRGAARQGRLRQGHQIQRQAFLSSGSFFDLRNGGECWSCPAGTNRTIFPVTNNNACKNRAGVAGARPSSAARRRHRSRRARSSMRGGGEWWKCPGNRPRRTLYAVTDARAARRKTSSARSWRTPSISARSTTRSRTTRSTTCAAAAKFGAVRADITARSSGQGQRLSSTIPPSTSARAM